MKFKHIYIFLSVMLCFGVLAVNSGYANEMGAQGLIGFTKLDKDELKFNEMEPGKDLDLSDEPDLSKLASIGGVCSNDLIGDKFKLGIEYGGIFSGMVDNTDATAVNGTVFVSADTSLFLLDLFLGPQLNFKLGDKLKLYCGAGPLLMIGYVSGDFKQREIEQEYDVKVKESNTSAGAGGYVRLGAELKIGQNSSLGLGARAFNSKIDFQDTLGEVDIKGVQGFLTFSTRW